jgi:uncharacterized membrane protein
VPLDGTETLTTDSFAMGDPKQSGDVNEGWWSGKPTDKGTVLWTRTTRVRQYSVGDLSDGKLDTPLAGNTAANFVQLKEIEVVMNNPKQGILGSGQGITMRILKPF